MTYHDKILIDNKDYLLKIFIQKGCDYHFANDMYQELYIKVNSKIDKYDSSKGKFLGWVIRLANNMFIDYIRKQKRSKEIAMKYWNQGSKQINITYYIPDETLNQEQKTIHNDLCNNVWQQFFKLCDNQKQILEMRVLLGMSYKEIVKVTGSPQGVLAARLSYARKHLRKRVNF